jgi:hypothetical protein
MRWKRRGWPNSNLDILYQMRDCCNASSHFISKQTWQWVSGSSLRYISIVVTLLWMPQDIGALVKCEQNQFRISPYSMFCRWHLPFDESFHRTHSLQDLDRISTTSSLFAKFDRQIEVLSRETRELFDSSINKPEHLQSVLSEFNLVSTEVDNASKVL